MKNTHKRLSVHRETIRGLSEQEMGGIMGGGFVIGIQPIRVSVVGGDCPTGTIQPALPKPIIIVVYR